MVSFDGGSASKVDDVTALPSRHKMEDMCYYGIVMTTTRWWLCVTILHLQQYSHRLNLFFCYYLHKLRICVCVCVCVCLCGKGGGGSIIFSVIESGITVFPRLIV